MITNLLKNKSRKTYLTILVAFCVISIMLLQSYTSADAYGKSLYYIEPRVVIVSEDTDDTAIDTTTDNLDGTLDEYKVAREVKKVSQPQDLKMAIDEASTNRLLVIIGHGNETGISFDHFFITWVELSSMLTQRENFLYPTLILACYSSNTETSQLQNVRGFSGIVDGNAAWSITVALILKNFPSRLSNVQKDEVSNSFLMKAIDYQNQMQLPLASNYDHIYGKAYTSCAEARAEAYSDAAMYSIGQDPDNPLSWTTDLSNPFNIGENNPSFVTINSLCDTQEYQVRVAAILQGYGFNTDTGLPNGSRLFGLYLVVTFDQHEQLKNGAVYYGVPMIDEDEDPRAYCDDANAQANAIKNVGGFDVNALINLLITIAALAIFVYVIYQILIALFEAGPATDGASWVVAGALIVGLILLFPSSQVSAALDGQTSESIATTHYDNDGDTWINGAENIIGTDPNNVDTDSDNLWDNQEYTYSCDPLLPNTDADYLPDGLEVSLGFNPNDHNDPVAPSEAWKSYSFINNQFNGIAWQNTATRAEIYALPTSSQSPYMDYIGNFYPTNGQFIINFNYNAYGDMYVRIRYYVNDVVLLYEDTMTAQYNVITHSATFAEPGLPSGTSWSVIFDGQSYSSTSKIISISCVSDSSTPYSYSIVPPTFYTASPSSGSITVNGDDSSQAIVFTHTSHSVIFTESGLPSGNSWSLTFDGQSYSSTSTTITITSVLDNNTPYSYSIGTPPTFYTAFPSSGSITVNGNDVNQAITYTHNSHSVTFTASGLPSGAYWSITFNGQTYNTMYNPITFYGVLDDSSPYSYSITAPTYYYATPSSGSVIVNGAGVNIPVTIARIYYTLTFTAYYKPGGTFSMYINGVYYSSSGNSISVSLAAGTSYTYSVNNIYWGGYRYYPSPASGSGTITGNTNTAIYFSRFYSPIS